MGLGSWGVVALLGGHDLAVWREVVEALDAQTGLLCHWITGYSVMVVPTLRVAQIDPTKTNRHISPTAHHRIALNNGLRMLLRAHDPLLKLGILTLGHNGIGLVLDHLLLLRIILIHLLLHVSNLLVLLPVLLLTLQLRVNLLSQFVHF